MSITPAMKHFINAEKFAVIGRVMTDRTRFDNKVLRWYQAHDLAVTPIKPVEASSTTKNDEKVEGLSMLNKPDQIQDRAKTAISIIINPKIGYQILQSLYPLPSKGSAEPHGVWFQPGAESEEIKKYVKERGIEDRVMFSGECILRSGEELIKFRRKDRDAPAKSPSRM